MIKGNNTSAGFTLLEVMVTVILIGILASLALPRYMQTVEKGRSAEARNVLGMIRSAQNAYFFENGFYTGSFANLSVIVPTGACNSSYFFRYSIGVVGLTYTAQADRCTAGGKSPNSFANYLLNITQTGDLGGSQGYL